MAQQAGRRGRLPHRRGHGEGGRSAVARCRECEAVLRSLAALKLHRRMRHGNRGMGPPLGHRWQVVEITAPALPGAPAARQQGLPGVVRLGDAFASAAAATSAPYYGTIISVAAAARGGQSPCRAIGAARRSRAGVYSHRRAIIVVALCRRRRPALRRYAGVHPHHRVLISVAAAVVGCRGQPPRGAAWAAYRRIVGV